MLIDYYSMSYELRRAGKISWSQLLCWLSAVSKRRRWVEQEKRESARVYADRSQLNQKQKQTISPSGNLKNAARPCERPPVNSSYNLFIGVPLNETVAKAYNKLISYADQTATRIALCSFLLLLCSTNYQSDDCVPDSEPIDYVLATAAVKQLLRDNVATNITIPRWMGHKVILLFNCKIEFPNSWF